MADMFGAPIGIGAAEQDQRENVLGGLQAMAKAGEIAMQPAEQRLKEAHARLFEAEAGGKEQDLAAQQALGEFYRLQGGTDAQAASDSPAAPLYEAANFLFRRGFVNAGTAKLKDATLIDSRVAQGASRQAAQRLSQLKAEQQEYANEAQLAQGVTDDASYRQYLLQQQAAGKDVEGLPQTYDASAKNILGQIVSHGMTAHQQADLQIKRLNAESVAPLRKARETAAYASADAARAHSKLLKERLAAAVKNGGENSPTARALKESITAWNNVRRNATVNAALPPPIAQADPKRVYVTQTGIRVRAAVDPSDGKMKWMHVGGPAPVISAPISSTPPDDSNDDTGDEEDDE